MPKFKHVIFCDDIRTEQNGKKFLIGVYTGKLLAESFPLGTKLSILIIVDPSVDGSSVALEIRLRSGAKIAEANADIPPPTAGHGEPGYIELTIPLMVSAEDVLEVLAGPSPTRLEMIGHLPIDLGLPGPG